MTNNPDKTATLADENRAGIFIGNAGEPIRFAQISAPDGITGQTALPGQQIKVWLRRGMTSDDPIFHRIASELRNMVYRMAQENGKAVDIERTNVLES